MKKRKSIIVLAALMCAVLILGTTALAQTLARQPIIGFSDMAAKVETDYGTVLELDLAMRNDNPVYRANVVIGGQRVLVFFNAITGAEIERRDAVVLDEDELRLYNSFETAPSASQQTAAVPVSVQQAKAQPAQTQNDSAVLITFERAMEIAVARVGGGSVRDIELDRLNGVQVYEVEVRFNGVEYDVYVNAATGEVERFKEDGTYNVNSASANAQPLTEAKITFEQAKAIAVERAGGGEVREIDLERKNGALVYEIEVRVDRTEYDVDVCAATGDVLRFRIDD